MNKEEAANYLGCSVRALERYTQKGRIAATYVKGKTRPTVEYREEDLSTFKVELEAELYPQRPAVEKPVIEDSANLAHNPAALARLPALAASQSDFAELVGVIVRESVQAASAGVPVIGKLVLSLREASAVAGIPRARLLAAIESGKLKASKDTIGRGWRIKRVDLELYVVKL